MEHVFPAPQEASLYRHARSALFFEARGEYRPDIDGLRAIAVSFVVMTHAGLSNFFQGGFIGVDIFFVISGYLISSILLREISEGRFSVARFYRRRILRIIPALAVVITASSIAAYLYLFPSELEEYAKSAIAALFFTSNIFYWLQSGYFDAAASSKPLLHTWSLAIEEQFYIGFPIFLYICHRYWRNHVSLCVTVVMVMSFGFSVWEVFRDENAAFYLVQYRTWELMLGVLVALNIDRLDLGVISRNSVAAAALAMIVVPAFLYDSHTPFPGLAALPPCLGAALIIHTGKSGSVISRLLSFKPFVFVGLVSYSFYLWHWPLLVFHRMGMPFFNFPYTKLTAAALMALAFLLAVLSWRYVERPFRRKWVGQVSTQRIYICAALLLAMLAAGNIGFWAFRGLPWRLPPSAVQVASFLNYDPMPYYRAGKCFLDRSSASEKFDFQMCLISEPGRKNYLLMGDSNAAHLYSGLAAKFADVTFSQVTAAGCKPLRVQAFGADRSCVELMNYVFNTYIKSHHVDRLLIAALWTDADIRALRQTLDWTNANHIPVTLFGPVPRYTIALPRLAAMSIRDGNRDEIQDAMIPAIKSLDRQMEAIAAQRNVNYVSMYDVMCPAAPCRAYVRNDEPIQFDEDHLTYDGSLYVAGIIRERRLLE